MPKLAPEPGTTPTAIKEKEAERRKLRITFYDEVYEIDFEEFGPEDDLATRKQCGVPVTAFFEEDRFASDSFAVLIWAARRRKLGSRRAGSFRAFLTNEFPNFRELSKALSEGQISIEAIESDDEEDPTERTSDSEPTSSDG